MWSFKHVVFCTMFAIANSSNLAFPPHFEFGVGTSAYQVEGAWNYSDKGASVWDRFTHDHSDQISGHNTGDVACDSFRKYKEDVKLISDLGVDIYKFSISWSRILPTGFGNQVSEEGIKYYSDLIDELLKNGIKPLVVIYHWDLPQQLQDLGGWTNPQIVEWFAVYVRVIYTHYGSRVTKWITINEPIMVCDYMYALNIVGPWHVEQMNANYICSKHTMLAHAKAWRIYDEEFRPKYHGKVSIANQIIWMEGKTVQDQELEDLMMEFTNGRFSHPIFSKHGGWPPKLEAAVREHSTAEGYNVSRLPPFTAQEINLIKGTYDYYGVNYYTGRVAHPAERGEPLVPFPLGDAPEFEAKLGVRPEWKYGASKHMPIYKKGFRKTFNWINDVYGPLEILITENGYPSSGSNLNDSDRIEYMRDHLEQVLLAIHEDGINITGYIYWSLMDDFEWLDGYDYKFGLYEVDFSSPERTRTPRSSVRYYSDIIQQRALLATYNSGTDSYKQYFNLNLVHIVMLLIILLFNHNLL